jgi:hypothetical protein
MYIKVSKMENTTNPCPYIPVDGIAADKNHPGLGSCRTCIGIYDCPTRLQETFYPRPNHTWEAKATFEYATLLWVKEIPPMKTQRARWWLTVWIGGSEFVTDCAEKEDDYKCDASGRFAEEAAKKRALMDMIEELSSSLIAAVSVPHGINSLTLTILRTKDGSGAWG